MYSTFSDYPFLFPDVSDLIRLARYSIAEQYAKKTLTWETKQAPSWGPPFIGGNCSERHLIYDSSSNLYICIWLWLFVNCYVFLFFIVCRAL